MRFFILTFFMLFSIEAFSQSSDEKKIPEEEDWAKQATVLNSREAKVKNYTREIKELIETKKKAKSKKEKQEIIDQMIEKHALLKKETDEYNKIRLKLKYRFPDKGNVTDRKYLPRRIQSIEQMEEDSTLDARLTQIRKRINQQYRPFITRELSSKQEFGPIVREKKKKEREKSEKIVIER